MKILAHRGCWDARAQKNSAHAFQRALANGYGFESDIREYKAELVISHDVANASCQPAREVFKLLAKYEDRFCFAINIKADGLKELLLEQLNTYQIHNYFAFDMSVPQMVEYAKSGLTFFTRQSEIETVPSLYEEAAGVWIDGFYGEDWISEGLLKGHLDRGKQLCLVSPELHGRPYEDFWARILSYELDFSRILLCTDAPDMARRTFQGVWEANSGNGAD